MDSRHWNSLSKQVKVALLKSAGLPSGLSQLSWSGLQKSERKKLEAIKGGGKGWHEKQEDIRTEKGIEKKAPIHRKVALEKEASEANNKPMQKKSAHEEKAQPKAQDKPMRVFQKNQEELELINGRAKIKKGIFKGKTAFRCPECFRGLTHFACGEHGRIDPDDAPDLRNIGKDEKTTKIAREIYEDFVAQVKESRFKSIQEFYDSLPEGTLKEYWLLAIGLEKIFGKKEKSLSGTTYKTYDPKFEQSEDERMKDESRREEETYGEIVMPEDTGDVGEMKAHAGIDEAYRGMGENWFTQEKQKEWEKHEAEGYEGNPTKPYDYYLKTYPLAMEWVSKHFKKIDSTKELEEAVQVYFSGDWKEFVSFLQEKQEELTAEKIEKEHKAEERKKELQSKYFTTKFRDIGDHNKKECVERTPVQKAHPFGHKGIALFAHKDGKEWKVTEATTGLELARAHQFKGAWRNNTKEEIIRTAKEFIDEKTPEKVSELIKYAADTISRIGACQ